MWIKLCMYVRTLQYLMLRAGPSRYRGPPVTRYLQLPIASWRAKFPLHLQEGYVLLEPVYFIAFLKAAATCRHSS